MICRSRSLLVRLGRFQGPALATRDVMLAILVKLKRVLSVLSWHVLQCLPIFLDDAAESCVFLDGEDGDLGRWLELRVVLIHTW